MGATIGSNEIYMCCDSETGCRNTSQKFKYFDMRTMMQAEENIRKTGWYVSASNGKSYCPEHSPYNWK